MSPQRATISPISLLVLFVIFVHFTRPCILLAQSVTPELLSQVRTLASSAIPAKGSIEAVYITPDGAGEVAIGYDAPTGAWYFINTEAAIGADAQGRSLAGAPRHGGVKTGERAREHDNQCLEPYLPFLIVKAMLDSPQYVRSIEPRTGGGYRLTAEYPAGMRAALSNNPQATPQLTWVEIGSDGAVVARGWENSRRRTEEFQYDPRSSPPFRLPKIAPAGSAFRLASFTFHEQSVPEAFEPARVESLAIQSHFNSKESLAAQMSAINAKSPQHLSTVTQWTRTLIGVGILLLGIGGYAWWRNRG